MKTVELINIGVLPLLLEAMCPAYALLEQRENEAKQLKQGQEVEPILAETGSGGTVLPGLI